MPVKPQSELVKVFSGTTWQAEMVKSLLENAGIKAFIKDSIMGTLAPWYTAPGGAGSVKVFVSSTNFEIAKQIAGEFEANTKLD